VGVSWYSDNYLHDNPLPLALSHVNKAQTRYIDRLYQFIILAPATIPFPPTINTIWIQFCTPSIAIMVFEAF
jgi:hypothetical protein